MNWPNSVKQKEFLVGFSKSAYRLLWLMWAWTGMDLRHGFGLVFLSVATAVNFLYVVFALTRVMVPGSNWRIRGDATACALAFLVAFIGSFQTSLGIGIWSGIGFVATLVLLYVEPISWEQIRNRRSHAPAR